MLTYSILSNNFPIQSEENSAKYPHNLMLADLSDVGTEGWGADFAQPLLLAPPHFSPFRHPWIPFIDATKIKIKDIEFGQ